jgi:excisionase family DNA binding protein
MVVCPYCGGEMEYLTVSQVAQVLGLSGKTVRKYIRQNRFPGTITTRGVTSPMMYRVPATAVLPLIKESS